MIVQQKTLLCLLVNDGSTVSLLFIVCRSSKFVVPANLTVGRFYLFFRNMCIEKYGVAPEVKVVGHVTCMFPYLAPPLEYILHELLKNAMR